MYRNNRFCSECGAPFSGRRNKKFCSRFCRIAFHNSKREKDPPEFYMIKDALIKNRSVLRSLYMNGVRRTTVNNLRAMNFSFEHFTGLTITYTRSVLYRYFDFGLVFEGDDLIVLRTTDMEGKSQ